MRTTMILPDELYRQVKERARAQERTVTSLVEDALRRELARKDEPRRREPSRLAPATGSGGLRPGVDPTNNAALLDLLDEDVPVEKLR